MYIDEVLITPKCSMLKRIISTNQLVVMRKNHFIPKKKKEIAYRTEQEDSNIYVVVKLESNDATFSVLVFVKISGLNLKSFSPFLCTEIGFAF